MKKTKKSKRMVNMTSAVIVAAGRGTRMKYNPHVSKQHIDILGKSVVLRTIEKFVENELIDEIILVIIKEEEKYFKENVLNKIRTSKPIKLVYGGAERVDSSYNGILATDERSEVVLIHDGVRPFVKESEIRAVIEATK